MAAYVFETITQDQAARFTAQDFLTFQTGSASQVVAAEAGSNGLTLQGISLTFGGKTVTFPANELSPASQAARIQFADSSRLILGTNAGTDPANPGATPETLTGTSSSDSIYGFSGGDTITGANGADNLYGGLGADSIDGGTQNDHLYGNNIGNTMPGGTQDGNDTLNGGDGGDYIQGNQGDDIINGGNDSDRIFGGSGNDTITGGEVFNAAPGATNNFGSDSINGNTGNDTISGGNGDDSLRGGADDDMVMGEGDNDRLFGDNGNDTLVGGLGLDILSGGAGTNTFSFNGTTDSTFVTQGGSFANIVDQITDFQLNNDALLIGPDALGGAPAAGGDPTPASSQYNNIVKDNGVSFNSVEFARTYAQGLLNDMTGTGANQMPVDTTTTVAAVQVNSDTYLFFDGDQNGVVESAIRLNGINVTDVTVSSLFGV